MFASQDQEEAGERRESRRDDGGERIELDQAALSLLIRLEHRDFRGAAGIGRIRTLSY